MYEEKATPMSTVKEQIEEKFTDEFVKLSVSSECVYSGAYNNHSVSFSYQEIAQMS